LSTLPVEINWDGLDPGPFRRYKYLSHLLAASGKV